MSVLVPRLGPLLWPSWGSLGPSWAPLGPSWGPLGGLLGRLGAVLGASGAILERRKLENARTRKTSKPTREINDLCILGLSWRSSWSALGASLGPLGPFWRHLGPSWRLWWPPRSVLEAILGIWDALESARDVSWRRQSLGKRGRCTRLGASRRGGGPLEDYRNPARQHLAF